MTVRRGVDWGSRAPIPEAAVHVDSDSRAGQVLTEARLAGRALPPLALHGGDMARTLGVADATNRLAAGTGTRVVLDIVRADFVERSQWFLSHLVMRRPTWQGPFVVVANAAFVGRWNVAPRGHPGDGRFDLLQGRLGLFDRLAARRRLPHGTHVPHPDLHTAKIATHGFEPDRASTVRIDGRRVPCSGPVTVTIEPDALEVWL